jgi:RNA polymerase sigma-70 factor, ECF subfamily
MDRTSRKNGPGLGPSASGSGDRPDEQALIDRIVLGDEAALSALYEVLAPRAYAIALKILKDAAEAEEVLQDTFLEVWRSATRFDPARAAPERWVGTMARTRAIDRLRKRSSRDRTLAAVAVLDVPKRPTPEDLLGTSQVGARVRQALAELPNEQRRALELAYFEGLSQSEIAATTETPLGTVKTRMRLAMIKLAETLP